MKLPYIKVEVEYREEETGAPGKVSPALIVGFGLHWAWVYLFMFNGQYVLFPEADSMQLLLSATSGAVHAMALLLYAICLKQARALFDTPGHIRRNRVVAACLVAAATVLCMAGNLASVGPLAALCFVAAGATSGVGSAMLLMSFGVSFSVCDLPTIALCTALSLVVSAVAFALTLLVSSALVPAGALLCLALPFLELLCLNKCSADLVDKLEFAFLTMPVRTASFAGRVGVPSVIFGVLLGVLRCCALTGPLLDGFLADGVAANAFSSSVFTASVFTCLALIMAMLTLRRSRNFAFRVLVPVIAALLVLLCSPCGADSFFRCFALFSSYFMLEASLWVMYSDIAQSYRVSAFTTYGFGHGLLSAGSLAGFLMLQPGGLMEAVPADSAALALVGLMALTLGVATLPNATEMRSTLIRGRFCPLLDDRSDLEELVSGGGAAAADERDGGASASPAGASETGEGLSGVTDACTEPPCGDGSPVAAGLPIAGGPSVADGLPAGAEALAGGPASGAFRDAASESPEQRAGRFKRKCAAVADTFLLSRKETEVLFLLAKGRNSAAIQEALYISAGTANTHMRHIYRKLDVHSQHELINLVESMEVE
ncbi:helix-turn-helix transcriptional regulator [Adlercreutzia caecimuris]|uniref:helix-turn-helix transcriptional regulator n=1 Tax=Adlercreutzia caecimuris TaxID=671266 RepID=UPI001C3F0EF9|nr:helix-turn-helix transcriptional regulator [Adlercreutzia caecimuris]MCR2037031.1 helix-turn-helix transcriptional regulator [Adlercreutzia caecimuris]